MKIVRTIENGNERNVNYSKKTFISFDNLVSLQTKILNKKTRLSLSYGNGI